MMEYSNDVYQFKKYKGQLVEAIMHSGMKFCGTLAYVDAGGVDIIDCKGRMIHLQNGHIEAIVEPRMRIQRICSDNDCACGQGYDCREGNDCCGDNDCRDGDDCFDGNDCFDGDNCFDSDDCFDGEDCFDGDNCFDSDDCFDVDDCFDGLDLNVLGDNDDCECEIEREETCRCDEARHRQDVSQTFGNRNGFRDRG